MTKHPAQRSAFRIELDALPLTGTANKCGSLESHITKQRQNASSVNALWRYSRRPQIIRGATEQDFAKQRISMISLELVFQSQAR